jgi:hypothetical protein
LLSGFPNCHASGTKPLHKVVSERSDHALLVQTTISILKWNVRAVRLDRVLQRIESKLGKLHLPWNHTKRERRELREAERSGTILPDSANPADQHAAD